ncbi:MAG: acylphosphatase [Treponema sp.]|nr:acylphosphatase [Treponema sp.]
MSRRTAPDFSAFSAQVEGRVQGVGFRYSCIREGRRLGLTGWVRNTPDGDVEVWAEGPADKLEMLLQWLRRGPPGARVEAVRRYDGVPTAKYRDFGLEY